MYAPALGVDAVGEPVNHLTPVRDGVVAAQPVGPYPVRRDVAALLELVQPRVDRRRGQFLRVGESCRGCFGGVQLDGGRRHLFGERAGFLDPLVEGHDGVQVHLRRVFQQRGLEQREPSATQCVLRQPQDRVGVPDLQHIDLEAREDRAFHRLRQPKIENPGAVRVGVVLHRRDHHLPSAWAVLRAGGGEDAGGGGQVEPESHRNPGLVVDRRPRPTHVPRGHVPLV